jgi:hypothetical protein
VIPGSDLRGPPRVGAAKNRLAAAAQADGEASMPVDEGPSPDDLRRFDRDTGYCPACGAAVWDQAEVCPKCREYLGGETLARPPVEHWFRQRWFVTVAIIVLIAFILLTVRWL